MSVSNFDGCQSKWMRKPFRIIAATPDRPRLKKIWNHYPALVQKKEKNTARHSPTHTSWRQLWEHLAARVPATLTPINRPWKLFMGYAYYNYSSSAFKKSSFFPVKFVTKTPRVKSSQCSSWEQVGVTYHWSLTRVTKSYLLALGTTQISSYFTKHWTKFLTH